MISYADSSGNVGGTKLKRFAEIELGIRVLTNKEVIAMTQARIDENAYVNSKDGTPRQQLKDDQEQIKALRKEPASKLYAISDATGKLKDNSSIVKINASLSKNKGVLELDDFVGLASRLGVKGVDSDFLRYYALQKPGIDDIINERKPKDGPFTKMPKFEYEEDDKSLEDLTEQYFPR